jgi:hypothetical protein
MAMILPRGGPITELLILAAGSAGISAGLTAGSIHAGHSLSGSNLPDSVKKMLTSNELNESNPGVADDAKLILDRCYTELRREAEEHKMDLKDLTAKLKGGQLSKLILKIFLNVS